MNISQLLKHIRAIGDKHNHPINITLQKNMNKKYDSYEYQEKKIVFNIT